jgi:hypothetical protein
MTETGQAEVVLSYGDSFTVDTIEGHDGDRDRAWPSRYATAETRQDAIHAVWGAIDQGRAIYCGDGRWHRFNALQVVDVRG